MDSNSIICYVYTDKLRFIVLWDSGDITKGFLIVAPGLTIKVRLRVLQPNDPDSYYQSREIVPSDMLDDVKKAKIVITNYHVFKLRERIQRWQCSNEALDISRGDFSPE